MKQQNNSSNSTPRALVNFFDSVARFCDKTMVLIKNDLPIEVVEGKYRVRHGVLSRYNALYVLCRSQWCTG